MNSTSSRRVKEVLDEADTSLLEVIDHVLNQGVVLSGEVVIGLAGVDLIYLRVAALLCAADRLGELEQAR